MNIDYVKYGMTYTRFFRLLPALALLLGALSLFAAAPAKAQPPFVPGNIQQNSDPPAGAVWSATLTVKAPDGDRGCFAITGDHACTTALDDDDFTVGDTSYDVHGLVVAETQGGTRYLDLYLNKKIPDAVKALKLCLGTTGFALSDGTITDDTPANDKNVVQWSSSAVSGIPSWSVGNTVPVSLASSCSVEALTFGFENATYLVEENVGSVVPAVVASREVAADTTITITATDGTSHGSDPSAVHGTDL